MADRKILGVLSIIILFGFVPAARAQEYKRPARPPAQQSAIRELHISNDRWPDAYTLRSFAQDAIRLERAGTQEEEAIALYNWIARVMTIGGSPYEGPPGKESPVMDTLKIMSVYGNHWCDGQARLLETMWRSLGRQGCRLYIPMRHHSFVELQWRDRDGQERWHALDVNNGWYVRNEQGWIASSEDVERNPLLVLGANQDLKMRTKGWLRTHLSTMPEHSMALQLRRGESYKLLWENGGFYFVNPKTRASVSSDSPLYQPGGPYSRFIGGSETVYVPDFSHPGWMEDFKGEPENIAAASGRLQPKAAARPSSFVYQFDYPYLIADALAECVVTIAAPEASASVSFSADGGKSWNRAWGSTAVGTTNLRMNLGLERDRSGGPSVLGLYSYLLRFDLRAQTDPAEVTVGDLRFTHRTMLNKMTLPNLQPGWNHLKIGGQSMAAGSCLRILLEWTDKNGRQLAERTATQFPFEFDVFANCSGGAGLHMHSIEVRAEPSLGTAEMKPVPRIQQIIEGGRRKDNTQVDVLIRALKEEDPEIRYWAADGLGKTGNPAAIPSLIAALHDPLDAVRMSACVALGDLKAREAVPGLVDLITGGIPAGKGYSLFMPIDVGAVQWMAARALGRIGDARAVEPLSEVLQKAGGDLGVYVAGALGDLGDRRALPALIEASRKHEEPAQRAIVEALGRLGDPRGFEALLDSLRNGKEDVRYAAAIALGRLGDLRAGADLQETSRSDPQSFVREAAAGALAEISKGKGSSPRQ